MLFRGQRLRFKCDGPTKSLMKFVSLEKEPTTNGRKKRSRKEEKCLHARNQKERHRRDRQSL